MPRTARVEYEGAVYHVMARGNRREAIVRDDEDRETFLRTLEQACERCGWEVFAWVLLDNHYHLAFRTPEPNLVVGMQWLQNTYTRRINTRHHLWGHLFGGRYRAVLVEDDPFAPEPRHSRAYLSILLDYIHLNPVRAGLVDLAEESLLDYPWSSLHQGYARPPTKRPSWLKVEEGLSLLGYPDRVAGRRRMIAELEERGAQESREQAGVNRPKGQSLQSTLRRGWYWGSQAFAESLAESHGGEIKKKRSRNAHGSGLGRAHDEQEARRILQEGKEHFGVATRDLRRPRRGDLMRVAIAWALARHTTVPQRWIAEQLNLKSPANVSQQVRRFEGLKPRQLAKEIVNWKLIFVD